MATKDRLFIHSHGSITDEECRNHASVREDTSRVRLSPDTKDTYEAVVRIDL